MSNDAYFQKKWEECQANMCTGCEFCNNCLHGVECNTCEECNPPVIHKCKHGNGDDCETCEEIQQAKDDADAWEDSKCEHGMMESECWDCGLENDLLAQHARDRDDWNHFHPVGDTE